MKRKETTSPSGRQAVADRLAVINFVGWVLCVVGSTIALIYVLVGMAVLSAFTRRLDWELVGLAAILVIQAGVGVATMLADRKREHVIPALALLPIVAAYVLVIPILQSGFEGIASWSAAGFGVVATLSIVRLAFFREPD